jgi:hypothetical protein
MEDSDSQIMDKEESLEHKVSQAGKMHGMLPDVWNKYVAISLLLVGCSVGAVVGYYIAGMHYQPVRATAINIAGDRRMDIVTISRTGHKTPLVRSGKGFIPLEQYMKENRKSDEERLTVSEQSIYRRIQEVK